MASDGCCVLVVEPHPLLRELMVELLQRLPCVEVGQASDLVSAIDRARSRQPAFVLLEAALPELSTGEAIEQFKVVAPSARLILIGDQPIEAYKEVADRSGAALCLSKDKMGTELLPALQQLIDLARVDVGPC